VHARRIVVQNKTGSDKWNSNTFYVIYGPEEIDKSLHVSFQVGCHLILVPRGYYKVERATLCFGDSSGSELKESEKVMG
jgi:hypothetical protein